MRRPRRRLEVSTFPFLAVLLCAMGSLILLLLVLDRRAKSAAQARAQEAVRTAREEHEAELRAAAEAASQRAAERAAERERRRRELHDELAHARDELAGQLQAVTQRQSEATQTARKQREHWRDLLEVLGSQREELARAEKEAAADRAGAAQTEQMSESARKATAQLSAQLRGLELVLAELKAARKRATETYSILPYRGKRGDGRRPLYVECTAVGLVFHPDRKTLTRIATAEEIRDEVETRAARQRQRVLAQGGQPEKRAYLLMLVRPDGIPAYYGTLNALRDREVDFGYEFIDADWELDFPDDDDSVPRSQPWMTARAIPVAPADPSSPTRKVSGLRAGRFDGGEYGEGDGPPGTQPGSGSGSARSGSSDLPPLPGASGSGGTGLGRTTGQAGWGTAGGSTSGGVPGAPGVPGGSGQGGSRLAGGLPPLTGGAGGDGPGGTPGQTGSGAVGGSTSGGVPGAPGTQGGSGQGGSGQGGSGVTGGLPPVPGNSGGGGWVRSGNGQSSGLPGTGSGGGGNGPAGDGGRATGPGGLATGGTATNASGLSFGPVVARATPSAGGIPDQDGSLRGSPPTPGGGTGSGQSGGIPGASPPGPSGMQRVGFGSGGTGAGSDLPPLGPGGSGVASPGSGSPAAGGGRNPDGTAPGAAPTSTGAPPANPGEQGTSSAAAETGPADGASGSGQIGGSGGGQPGASAGGGLASGGAGGSASGGDRVSLTVGPRPPAGAQGMSDDAPGAGIRPGVAPMPDGGPVQGPALDAGLLPSGGKPSRYPAPPRPMRLVGNRDWVIPIECRADGILLRNAGQKIPLTALTGTAAADNPLLQSLKQTIARRQASVRPGEPPYRPQARFLIYPDGLRTYYLTFPLLEPLGIPLTRQNVEAEPPARATP